MRLLTLGLSVPGWEGNPTATVLYHLVHFPTLRPRLRKRPRMTLSSGYCQGPDGRASSPESRAGTTRRLTHTSAFPQGWPCPRPSPGHTPVPCAPWRKGRLECWGGRALAWGQHLWVAVLLVTHSGTRDPCLPSALFICTVGSVGMPARDSCAGCPLLMPASHTNEGPFLGGGLQPRRPHSSSPSRGQTRSPPGDAQTPQPPYFRRYICRWL